MITQVLPCPYCQETDIVKHGLSPEGKQRYRCRACREGRGGKDTVFLKLQALLEPFGITRFYTDGWGASERHIDPEQHHVGKEYGKYPRSSPQTIGPKAYAYWPKVQ